MTPVREIIDRKGSMVLCVDQSETVFDAISLMAEVNIGAVLVKEHETIAGIFTERDYLQKIALRSRSSKSTKVRDVMSSPVISAAPNDSVEQCLETMSSCRCRHLPVVEDDELLGIVSIGDLVKKILEEKDTEIEQLSQYITGSY